MKENTKPALKNLLRSQYGNILHFLVKTFS